MTAKRKLLAYFLGSEYVLTIRYTDVTTQWNSNARPGWVGVVFKMKPESAR